MSALRQQTRRSEPVNPIPELFLIGATINIKLTHGYGLYERRV
jgi:hypothetical protein